MHLFKIGRIAFVFPAKGKNSTSTICCYMFYVEMHMFVFVVNLQCHVVETK